MTQTASQPDDRLKEVAKAIRTIDDAVKDAIKEQLAKEIDKFFKLPIVSYPVWKHRES